MNTNSAVLTVAVVLALGVIGLFGWLFLRGEVSPLPQEQGGGMAAPEVAVFEEQAETYQIHAIYPEHPVIEGFVRQEIERFKTVADPAQMSAQELQWAIERPYSLEITNDPYRSGEYTSYILTVYTDTGGVHPNAAFRTFTFNRAGEQVELEDLFALGASYLPRISQQVYAGVITQLEERTGAPVEGDAEDTVRIGTSPTPETLQFFYLAGEDLRIIIPPYQAAAWAAGYFDIPVPLATLQDILK
jgi:hypothetical protein